MHYKKFKALIITGILVWSGLLGYGVYSFTRSAPSSSPTKSVLGTYSSQPGYTERFTAIVHGAVTFTGNALEISNPEFNGSQGRVKNGTGGTFITLDQNLQDPPYGPGTTSDWTKNSSAAMLDLPTGAQVLYAELVWGGNYVFKDKSVADKLDSPVNFTGPSGNTVQVNPEPTTAGIVYYTPDRGQNDHYYVRTQNVTDIIQQNGPGMYSLAGVPAIMDNTNSNSNGAGWTLAVAYAEPSLPVRKLSIYTTLEPIEANTKGNLVEVENIITPKQAPINGRLLLSALEGDSVLTGDEFTFGDSPNNMSKISGPNNPQNNFFGAQINGDNGQIDKRGTLGNFNASSNQIIGNERHGWDITNIDVSKYLKPSQTSAYAQATSQGDGYFVTALGIQIDVYAPQMELNLRANLTQVDSCNPGQLAYELEIKNIGSAPANNNLLSLQIPTGTTYINGSLELDGQKIDINQGRIELNTIEPNQIRKVTYKVKPSQSQNKIVNQSNLSFDYQMLPTLDPIQDQRASNVVESALINQSLCNPPIVTNPIQAVDDYITVPVGGEVILDLGNNDQNPDSVTIKPVSEPQNGTVVFRNNQWVYIPNPGFNGTDSFVYEVCDQSSQNCTRATVYITVRGTRRGQVLGAYENTQTPRSGGQTAWLISLGLISLITIGIGATMLSHLDPEKPPLPED